MLCAKYEPDLIYEKNGALLADLNYGVLWWMPIKLHHDWLLEQILQKDVEPP